MVATKQLQEVIIKLTLAEGIEILAIDLDEDAQEALRFIKEIMARKVNQCLHPPCMLSGPIWGPRKCKPECRESCCINGHRLPAKPRAGGRWPAGRNDYYN